jgi:NAD(P)-dependent dehydrogenase (short-subunit alcohol dehydrogenase family)
MNIFSLKGKSAIVIGGSGGIGRSLCHGLAEAGANICPVSRTKEILEQVAKELKDFGVETFPYVADINSCEEIERMEKEVSRQFGKIDILVNAQGFNIKRPALELEQEEFDKVVFINLNSVFLTCKIIGRHMVQNKQGKIINIGSITSFLGNYGAAAYASGKGGVLQLTKVLAVEWAPYHVNVNCIIPGYFITKQTKERLSKKEIYDKIISRTPMGRLGELKDLTGAVIYLASSASDFVTGAFLTIDGGLLACGI